MRNWNLYICTLFFILFTVYGLFAGPNQITVYIDEESTKINRLVIPKDVKIKDIEEVIGKSKVSDKSAALIYSWESNGIQLRYDKNLNKFDQLTIMLKQIKGKSHNVFPTEIIWNDRKISSDIFICRGAFCKIDSKKRDVYAVFDLDSKEMLYITIILE
ncbi:DUF7738 domain-containing protein [Leptospira koniambonensis]|uniref:DUF7738 domain-containing protein n=1 Tax=Leptospira koniambonensis TaxID=2484950 RepID=UPI003EBC1D92